MNPNQNLPEFIQVKSENDPKIQTPKTEPPIFLGSQMQGIANPIKRNCNCKQSKCIKLYCECFNSNVFCDSGCNCIDCLNNDTNQHYREKAIKYTLNRNPNAFQPKIANTPSNDNKSLDLPLNYIKHSKGCACKKSGCMKKYCECYQAKIACSEICKCSDCHNKVGMSGQFYKSSPTREEDGSSKKGSFLYKLLLAQDEAHLVNIVNEEFLWNHNENSYLNKKQAVLSQIDLEEACKKFLLIMKQSKAQFLRSPSEFHGFMTQKKEEEVTQPVQKKDPSETPNEPFNDRMVEEIENHAKNDKSEEKSNLDNELLCEDEKLENIEDNKTNKKMEIEENNWDNERKLKNSEKENKNQRFSFFEVKKRLILKEFINMLKSIN